MIRKLILLFLAVTFYSPLRGQTTVWTDLATNSIWETASNWSAGVPTATSHVYISTQPTDDGIIVTGPSVTIDSLTLDSTLTGPIELTTAGIPTLTVTGNLTNNSSYSANLTILLLAGGNITINPGTGGINMINNLNIRNYTVALNGNLSMQGDLLNFDIYDASDYGKINTSNGTIVFESPLTTTVKFTGWGYTGSAGDTFTFKPDGFSGNVILGSLPNLTYGLSWDTSNFYSSGVLVVVPEPQTLALMFGSLTAVFVLRRRRRARSDC